MRPPTITALSLVLLLALPMAALAHPGLDPDEVPPGQQTIATMVIPHGCDAEGGVPEEGEASPTTEVAVEVPGGIESITPAEKEGWELSVDEQGGAVVSWTWSAAGGATTDVIEFEITFTAAGAEDENIYFPVFQGCEEGSYRWIGTPEREAENPAMVLTIGPAPAGATETETDDAQADGGEGPSETATATPHETATEAATPGDDGNAVLWIVAAVVILALGGGGAALARRRA